MKLRTLIDVSIFNEQCDSLFTVYHNDREIDLFEVAKNKVSDVKIDRALDFDYFGNHAIRFRWNSDRECANKHFNINKIIINDQKIPAHTIKVMPYENEYIKQLQSTDRGKELFKKSKLYPGYSHGWYGDYEISFEFGDKQHFKKFSSNSADSFLNAMGIRKDRIYVDKKYQQNFHLK